MKDSDFDFDLHLAMDNAARNVVRNILLKLQEVESLPSKHHYYITFNTKFAGVQIPAHLEEKYPESMTIVVQHQFYNLKVAKEYFTISLSFQSVLEELIIPFDSLLFIRDPSIDFLYPFINKKSSSPDPEHKVKIRKIDFTEK